MDRPMANGKPTDPWAPPPDLVAVRERMREIFARLEQILAARRELENP